MTGIALHNFPAFEEAARRLREQGHTVISPHECEEVNHDAPKPWAYYMRRDIVAMMGCDTIVMLPGWEQSRGANLERHVAEALSFTIYRIEEL